MKYGCSLHQKLRKSRANEISQQMRQLAKLVLQVNNTRKNQANNGEGDIDRNQCICGMYFDSVVEATKQLCDPYDDPNGRPLFHKLFMGLKLGHSLVKCAELKKGLALRCDSDEMSDDAEAFLALHKAEWTNKISARALARLKQRAKVQQTRSVASYI